MDYISKNIEKFPCHLFLMIQNGLSNVLVQFTRWLTISCLYKCPFSEDLMNITATLNAFISIVVMNEEILMKASLFFKNPPIY